MASTTKKTEPGPGPDDDGQAAAAATPDPAPEPAAGPLVLEYLGGDARIYQFDGAPPQTAEPGDVCELPYDPDDGHWAPTKRKVNRRHDGHPDEVAKRSERQAAERARIHAALANPTKQAADAAGEA